MPIKRSIDKIKEELKPLEKYNVIVFGSYLRGNYNDIDIAVVTGKNNEKENIKIWNRLIGCIPEYFDLRIFELMPLNIQGHIIENYKVVYGNSTEISWYFYHYRKLWDDVKGRYFSNLHKSVKEKLEAVRMRKKVLKLDV